MLILVPWKPFVFGWLLLTAMILAGYAVYCIQEGRNPFSVEKYHLQQVHSHRATASTGQPQHCECSYWRFGVRENSHGFLLKTRFWFVAARREGVPLRAIQEQSSRASTLFPGIAHTKHTHANTDVDLSGGPKSIYEVIGYWIPRIIPGSTAPIEPGEFKVALYMPNHSVSAYGTCVVARGSTAGTKSWLMIS